MQEKIEKMETSNEMEKWVFSTSYREDFGLLVLHSMARIGGSRGRLVGDAIVLLLTLNSCWNPEAGKPAWDKTNAGNHGWLHES